MAGSCPSGYSSDNVLRLPAWVGPLSEPLGTDCYRHDVAFAVLSWMMIVLGIITLGVLSTEVFASNSLRTTRVTWVIQMGLWIDIIILLLLGLYKPEGCFAAWFVFCVLLWLSLFGMTRMAVMATAQTIAKVTGKSVQEVLGGSAAVNFYILLTLLCFAAVTIGSCATAVYVAQGDIERAKIFWSLHCMGFACYVFVAILIGTTILKRFVNLVEEVVQNARGNQIPRIGGTGSGSTAGVNVEDLVIRFNKGIMIAWGGLPLGCGAWIVHAFVLPVFWYLMLLHLCNAALMTYLIYFLYTPLSRRRKIVAKLKYFFLPAKWIVDSAAGSQVASAAGNGNNQQRSTVLSSSAAAVQTGPL